MASNILLLWFVASVCMSGYAAAVEIIADSDNTHATLDGAPRDVTRALGGVDFGEGEQAGFTFSTSLTSSSLSSFSAFSWEETRLGESIQYDENNKRIPFQDLMDVGEVLTQTTNGNNYKNLVISKGSQATSSCVDSLLVLQSVAAEESKAEKASRRLLTKGQCKSWCATNDKTWHKKCTWTGCSTCEQCTTLPTPRPSAVPTFPPTPACPPPPLPPPPPPAQSNADKLLKWIEMRKWMCKRLEKKGRTYPCCDGANNFTNPSCDVSFCWDTGDSKPFRGDIMPISVCYENQQNKCFQHFFQSKTMDLRVKTASICIKTGDDRKPLQCFKNRECDSLNIDLSKVCETQFETGPSSLKAATDQCVDSNSGKWYQPKKISASPGVPDWQAGDANPYNPETDCATAPHSPWGKALKKKKEEVLGMLCG